MGQKLEVFLLLGLPRLAQFLPLLVTEGLSRGIVGGEPLLVKSTVLVCLRAEHVLRGDCSLGIALTL